MACSTGKLGYVTAAAAYRALGEMDRAKNRGVKARTAGWHSGRCMAYRCAECHEWHLGHHTKLNRGALKARDAG